MYKNHNLTNFPFIKQLDSQDCGDACLRMIFKYYTKKFIKDDFFNEMNITKQGVTISELKKTADNLGFKTMLVKLDFDSMVSNINFPSIFFWNQNHFVIVNKINNNKVFVTDPAFGKTIYNKKDFLKGWVQNSNEGIVLLLEPTEELQKNTKINIQKKANLDYVTKYLKNHKVQLLFISITLLLSSVIELITPFFTQKIIDEGVFLKNVSFIYVVILSQIIVYTSRIGLEFYRSWLFIHISSRISLSIISDFLIKLMKLPLRFFNSKNIGDLTQRIQDHKRIEEFLSKDLIQTVFSFFSILIYSGILLYFNFNVFLVVLFTTVIEIVWIISFLEKIRINDHKNFTLQSNDHNKIYELINSIQEIKLNNLEEKKTTQWQEIQKSIYINNIEKLKINQKYESYRFISFFQTIAVIFISSIAVMNNELTIGSMLSIMFILGGLNVPVNQLLNFILQYQLVKVSFERLNEIHNKKEEVSQFKINSFNEIFDIKFENVNFSYDNNNFILSNINLLIPKNKTTAIVGVSGSGKTSLLKLILKFYQPQQGVIKVGVNNLECINNQLWRDKCGVILQDSFIFSDTIIYNVTLADNPDIIKFKKSLELANIIDFVEALPLKENTIIGNEGVGISQGQKQRIFIARAIYKNPDYLFFDEATNSLDAENEMIIVNNVNSHFKDKTVIVVAHRLSTVKNSDQIIVLDKGKIIEFGKHNQLIDLKGKYYSLIKNQLELGE